MVVILMGVVGSGKTTIGKLLAHQMSWQFADADDFHSEANKQKISHGIPLTDADRTPWLADLRRAIDQWNAEKQNVVLACSALKKSYRDRLSTEGVRFVYLKGSYDLILTRLRSRHGHFATESILKSQLEDLEEPQSEDAITVEVSKPPEAIASEIIGKLQ